MTETKQVNQDELARFIDCMLSKVMLPVAETVEGTIDPLDHSDMVDPHQIFFQAAASSSRLLDDLEGRDCADALSQCWKVIMSAQEADRIARALKEREETIRQDVQCLVDTVWVGEMKIASIRQLAVDAAKRYGKHSIAALFIEMCVLEVVQVISSRRAAIHRLQELVCGSRWADAEERIVAANSFMQAANDVIRLAWELYEKNQFHGMAKPLSDARHTGMDYPDPTH